jgi:hypothetical protein
MMEYKNTKIIAQSDNANFLTVVRFEIIFNWKIHSNQNLELGAGLESHRGRHCFDELRPGRLDKEEERKVRG